MIIFVVAELSLKLTKIDFKAPLLFKWIISINKIKATFKISAGAYTIIY